MANKLFITFLLGLLYQIGYSQSNKYKYEVSKKVYDAIVSAYSSNRNAPTFEIRQKNFPGGKQILTYFTGKESESPKIIMDEDVYDICKSMGADSLNALAALLGHELAHHYEKHDWCSSFAYLLDSKSELKQKLTKIAKDVKSANEAEADDRGGFYGYVAGFSTYDVSAKLLDKIYSYYNLPNSINGYPTKEERKQIASTSSKKLEQYKAIFDAGEVMYCLKEYSASASCFEFLADKFPSREMFGNIGIVKIMASMDYIEGESMPFHLPLEIDAGTRLKNHSVRGIGSNKEEDELRKNELIDDGIKYFEKAVSIDPTYKNAMINKGCASILRGNYAGAISVFNELTLPGKDKMNAWDLSKAYSLRAIAHYKNGNMEKAKMDFELAQKLSPISRNTYNLEMFTKLNKDSFDKLTDYVISFFEDEKPTENGKEKAINPVLEKIGMESANNFKLSNVVELPIPSNKFVKVSYIPHDTFKALKIRGDRTYSVLVTGDKYFGKTSQDFGLNEKFENIKKKYGEPTYEIDELKGKYLVYRKARIVFLLNRSNLLIKWFTYYY